MPKKPEPIGALEAIGMPESPTASELIELRHLRDLVAIDLFHKGWPQDDIYPRAELFLRIRACYLKGLRR